MKNSAEERKEAQGLRRELGAMVRPLLREMDTLLDERLVATFFVALRAWLLRHFCHRTVKRQRSKALPLYRLRLALSRLWLAYPDPIPLSLQHTPG